MPDEADQKRINEIGNIRREEEKRGTGKRYIGRDEKRERIGKAILELAWELDDENVFAEEISVFLDPGTEGFRTAIAAWREIKKRRI